MFPFFPQHDAMDCGPACLQMVTTYHGRSYPLEFLRGISHIDREGVSLAGIGKAAEKTGLRALAVQIPFQSSENNAPDLLHAPLPAIVHWDDNHFVVVYKITKKNVHLADPAFGKMKVNKTEFLHRWQGEAKKGFALLLEPTPAFYSKEAPDEKEKGFSYLFSYLRPYKKLFWQLLLGLLLGSFFQLAFPFLTQAIVDVGIENQDIGFIWLVLIGQLVLFLSQTVVEFIQSWILLHIGTRINVALISDFLSRLMRMPLPYFNTKLTGDLLQRIDDHHRIEHFLSSTTLSVLFSSFNFIVFSIVLLIYHSGIFLIFIAGAALYIAWISLFMKRRKQVDYQRFHHLSDNQNELIEIIQGMPEIKLQNSEDKHRNRWVGIQARLFRANIRALGITQYQDAGAVFISQLKDILITFVAAKAVIDGEMTLGMLLAVQYIIGQMNAPLRMAVAFARNAQDAGISLNRLQDIHQEQDDDFSKSGSDSFSNEILMDVFENQTIHVENLHFRYNALHEYVLKDINLVIPEGKITAIVGPSGSGKTTLISLLLGMYSPEKGQIRIGKTLLNQIAPEKWRDKCGAVLQSGFIFSDTITQNITESEKGEIDKDRFREAIRISNLDDVVQNMPLGFNSKIGPTGNGISAGQKQRILIARAVYKNPEILIFDEATNALDARNEKAILHHLRDFFTGKTVVIVAHRLSTVKNADNIVVLENGQISEQGTHKDLISRKGSYFQLVKEQLELGE